MRLAFRPLTTADYPRLLTWLSRAHVKEWWNDGDDTLEKVAQNYADGDGVSRFILVEENPPNNNSIGYFQYEWVADSTIGIDQFIGEADYLNRGVGRQAIKQFINMIAQKHNVDQIVLDPSPDNKRAIRCYENVGFRHSETKMLEDGSLAYLMRFDCRLHSDKPG